MTTTRKILVTGATGQQGGAVTRSLISRGQKVRVITRSPVKGRELEKLGAEVVIGDFEDAASISDAVKGVDGVFLMGTPFEKGEEAEIKQGEAVVNACLEHKVPHLVYTSVCAANLNTGIPHFESKANVEAVIKKSGLAYTILRPVFFMENLTSPWLYPSIEKGVLTTPLSPDRKLAMIAVSDIGEFAAEVFLRPMGYIGKEIDLAGDKLSMREVVAELSDALNREIRYEQIPPERAEEAVGHDFALMYRWFDSTGYRVDIEGLQKNWGVPLTPFSRWIGGALHRKKAA